MNLIQKLLIATGCLVALSGCKKDGLEPDNYLIYKIDGGTLNTVEAEADYFYDDNSIMLTNGSHGNDLYIFIDTNIRVGAYPIGNLSTRVGTTYYDDHTIAFNSDTGLLIIKSYDGDHVTGTFHFTATDGNTIKKFTEGQFSAKVSYLSFSPDTTCDDLSLSRIRKQKVLQLK